ncbi:MAG: hypothetical protein ACKO38_01965 [Planctomycetota bacterium]
MAMGLLSLGVSYHGVNADPAGKTASKPPNNPPSNPPSNAPVKPLLQTPGKTTGKVVAKAIGKMGAKAGGKPVGKSGDKAATAPTSPSALSRLPMSWDLPPLPAMGDGNNGAVAIGRLDVPTQADCVVYLRGGEVAASGRSVRAMFHLVEQSPSDDLPEVRGRWLVYPGRAMGEEATTAGANAGGAPAVDLAPSDAALAGRGRKAEIAELRRESDQLTFRWLEAAASMPSARQLANCVLEISAAQSRRFLPLRKTAKGEPLTFQFQEPMQARWELADAPEPGRVKVELRLGSKEPRYRFVGNSTLDASQGQTWIEFMDRRSAEALKLKIECELRGDQLRLQAAAFFQSPGEPNPVRLSPATYKRAVERVKAAMTQIEGQLATLAAAGKAAAARSGGGKAGGKGGAAARGKNADSPAELARKQWEKQLAAAREASKQLDDLAELQKLVDGRGQLLVRVVMEVEGQSVVLLQADKPAAPNRKP